MNSIDEDITSSSEANEAEIDSMTRTVQSELEHVEEQLSAGSTTAGVPNLRSGATGRAVYNSISSALGSIRSRLDEMTGNNGPTGAVASAASTGLTASAASTGLTASAQFESSRDSSSAALTTSNSARNVLGMLRQRLRNAELAHSAHVPLNMLQNELTSGTRLTAEQSSRRASVPPAKRKSDGEEPEPSDSSGSSSSEKRPRNSSRRASTLLASRRIADRVEGPQVDMELHGTAALIQTPTVPEIEEESIEAVLKDDSRKHEAERPSVLLLTRKSQSKLDLSHRSILFPELTETTAADTHSSASIVYSWGAGINSLHDDSLDISRDKAKVDADSRVGRTDILSCSVGKFHTACTTTDGKVLVTGSNTVGQVDPDRRDESIIRRPALLESLYQSRAVQVSCGVDHTAVVLSSGAVLTWGSNEHGQLGHKYFPSAPKTFCRPATMVLGPGRHATAVACGDGFTLCLTSRMSLMACGVEDITGNCDEASRRIPSQLPALEDLPLVAMAAGNRHAVAITSHGTVFAWGANSQGCCGREYPKKLSIPVPVKISPGESLRPSSKFMPQPLSNWTYQSDGPGKLHLVSLTDDAAVVNAACGDEHTVLVTRSGRLLVCGSNAHGQLGLEAGKTDAVFYPEAIAQPEGRSFVRAECGEYHTLVLDSAGDVWQMGGEGGDIASGCSQSMVGLNVQLIAAGGKHSVAIATRPRRSPPMREFPEREEEVKLADCMEDLIHALSDDTAATDQLSSTIASRAEEVFRTPAVMNCLFLDPVELEDFFSKLLNIKPLGLQQNIAAAIQRGIHKGLESVSAEDARLMWPEQVRFLLLYVQCPLFVDWNKDDVIFDRRGDLILSLCNTILDLSYEGYRSLMGWATSSVYPREVFIRLLIRPLLSQLEKGLAVSAGAERRPVPAIVQVLRWLFNASQRADNDVVPSDFYCSAIDKMDPEALLDDMMRYKKASKHQRAAEFFLRDNPFLFSPSTKRNLLQIENEMNMLRTAAATGLTYNAQERTFEFDPFWVLAIDREHILTQTLQKVEKAEPSDLRKKLRIVFKGEDGVDAGGVTREYFQLLCAELFDTSTGMWSSRFDGDMTWFNADCYWNDEGYYLSGVLVGLAVYNSVLLDVHFPEAVYRKLLGQPLGLEDMLDESIKNGLQQLLDYEGDDVEDVFCLTFDVNWVDGFGEQKSKELKPNGSDIPVTSDNKEEYVMLYVRCLLSDSVYAQYENFESGFMRVMEDSSLDMLGPEELELLVVGTPDLDFAALEKKTEYEGGYSAESDVVQNFWKFIKSAPRDTQLNFLKFATGTTRAPIGGLGEMRFKLQRAGPDSMHLPTSHTCFNTVLLPDYGSDYEKLEERLGRAIVECEGFGLQ